MNSDDKERSRPTNTKEKHLVSYQALIGLFLELFELQVADSKESGRGEWI
jgi:hypothetical protein